MPVLSGIQIVPPLHAFALTLALLVSGCAGDVGRLLIDPAKFDYHTCAQLEREMQRRRVRAAELSALMERAAQDSATIARFTYGPEYEATRSEMRLIQEVGLRKRCDPAIMIGDSRVLIAMRPI